MVHGRVSVEISSTRGAHGRGRNWAWAPRADPAGSGGSSSQAVIDGVILEQAVVRVALERCMKEGGFTAGDVHLGIAGLRAITRELECRSCRTRRSTLRCALQALDVIPFAIDKALISAATSRRDSRS